MKILFKFFLLVLFPITAWSADLLSEGRVLMSEGDTAAAAKKFSEAARVNPFDAAALNNQAIAYAAQGEHEKALNLLERAVRLRPDRADILANLTELRNWITRYAPQIKLKEMSKPIINVYPNSDVPPEPPPLWKK